MSQGLERIPLAVDSDYQYQPVRAKFPDPASVPATKIIAFEPDTPAIEPKPVETKRTIGEAVADTVYGFAKGAGSLVKGLGWLTNSDTIQELGQSAEDYWGEKQSADLQRQLAAVGKAEGVGGTISALWDNPAAIGDYVATSLPMMIPGMGAGSVGARGIIAFAGNSAKSAALRAGATETAAMQAGRVAAQKAAEKAATRFAVGANMVGEGAVSAGTTGSEVEQFAIEHGATPEEAKAAANKAAIQAGVWTTAGAGLGAGMETRAMLGKLKDTGIKGAAKNIGKEVFEETVQNPGEDYAGYAGKVQFDPSQTFDPGKSATIGAVTGGVMGGGIHGAGRVAERLSGKDQPSDSPSDIPPGSSPAPDAVPPSDGITPADSVQPQTFDALPNLPLEGEFIGRNELPSGQRLLDSPPIEGEFSTEGELPRLALPSPADGGPTPREIATARGLLNHHSRPSADLLMRTLGYDADMAARLYAHWQQTDKNGGQDNGRIVTDGTDAAVDSQGTQNGSGQLSGSGSALASAPAGNSQRTSDSAEMAASSVRQDLVDGIPGQTGVVDTPSVLDTIAHGAATSPLNAHQQPTEAQKHAGNYRKGHLRLQGLDISIENPAGSVRSGTGSDGKTWQTEMQHHYGYIKGTVGKDKDHLDVFLTPSAETADTAFVIDQIDPKTGRFDEHKIIIGASSEQDAKDVYHANYQKGLKGMGAITAMPMPEFKAWISSGKTKDPLAYVARAESAQQNTQEKPNGQGQKSEVLKTYPKDKAQQLAKRLVQQGLPSEIYLAPDGQYAIRPKTGEATETIVGTQVTELPDASLEQIAKSNQPAAEKAKRELSARNQPPIMRRDDIIGAIMRATGGHGVSSDMALTIAGDTANRLPKVRGLFTQRGQSDLDDLAMLLRENEGYDVKDGNHLSELIREAAGGNYAKSMERTAKDAAESEEKSYRDTIRQKAKKLGIKTSFVPFSTVEEDVLRALESRHAKAMEILDQRSQERFNEALLNAEKQVDESEIEAILLDVHTRGFKGRAFWDEATKIIRGMVRDAQLEMQDETIDAGEPEWLSEENSDRQGNSAAGRGNNADQGDQAQPGQARRSNEEVRQELTLEGQTNEEAAAQAAEQNQQETTTSKQQADLERDAVPFSLSQQSQPKPVGMQGGLFTADGRVSADAKQNAALELTGNELGTQSSISEMVKEAIRVARDKFAGKVERNESDGNAIIIGAQGIKHAMSGQVSKVSALAMAKLGEVVRRAKFIKAEPDKSGRNTIKEVRFYELPVVLGDEKSTLRVVVRVAADGSRYYDHFEVEKQTPAGQSGKPLVEDSTQPFAGAVPNESGNRNIDDRGEESNGNNRVDDFGERLGGSRKDIARNLKDALARELSDEELATQPLSKIWPKTDIDSIEDPFTAAFAFAAREEIPARPRVGYKLKRWIEQVKAMRSLASHIFNSSEEKVRGLALKSHLLAQKFMPKVDLLVAIDRASWSRIGEVSEHPNAFRYGEGSEKIPSPIVSVRVDGKNHSFYGAKTVADVVEKVNGLLGNEVQAKKMQFDVRGRGASFSINKKGDSEYRKLKTFKTSEEAFDYIKSNHDDLVAAWESVKERDNVKETDVRNSENRPRTANDWRNGKDVTVAEFQEKFGFRGGQFGNWVSQGSGAKERQWMLNEAHDALMDLSDILGIPPKAVSLNGSLGISFGARGSGNASAHYEPGNIIINLTKTKGAGTLGHEWFHALDNYFSRLRGETKFTGDQNDYRRNSYITYKPEPLLIHKSKVSTPMTKAQLDRMHEQSPSSEYFQPDNWHADPKHKAGVRPEVEKEFSELVTALDESPMAVRSRKNDKGPDGYWGRIIERGARAFENYVIHKMALDGYHNDYLANVRSAEDFPRSQDRYPYLIGDEIKPVAAAFDKLFETVQSRETDKGIALESRRQGVNGAEVNGPIGAIYGVADKFKSAFKGAEALDIRVVESVGDITARFRPSPYAEGVYHDDAGLIYLIAENLTGKGGKPDTVRAFQVLMHEAVGHYGLSSMMGERFSGILKHVMKVARDASVKSDIYGPGDRQYATVEAVRLRYPDASDTDVAQEVMARMAESDPTSSRFGYIRAVVRQWFRDMARAFGVDVSVTTDELNDLIALAAEHLRTGKNLETEIIPSGLVAASNKSESEKLREQYQWQAVGESDNGPVFSGEGFELDPIGAIPFGDGDFMSGGMADHGLMGHATHVTPGATPMMFAIMRGPAKIGELVADILHGDIVAIHDFAVYNQQRGDGANIVAHILANTYSPVRVIEALEQSRDFWKKVGINEFDQYGNGQIDWQSSSRYFAGKQRKDQSRRDGTQTIAAGSGASGIEVQELTDDEIKALEAQGFRFKKGLESRRHVAGDSGRQYSADQQQTFRNIGREVETPTIKERIAGLWSNIGKKMQQGIADQFAPLKDLGGDAYLLSRMSRGADGALEAMLMYGRVFMRDGVYDVDVKDGGVIDKLLRPLGAEADDFMWWVAGNRADTLANESEAARAEGARLLNQAKVLDQQAKQAEDDAKQIYQQAGNLSKSMLGNQRAQKANTQQAETLMREAKRLRNQAAEARARGNELKDVSRENLMTPADIDNLKALSSGKLDFDYKLQNGKVTRDRATAYADANAILQDFNRSVLDIAEQSGLIDGADRAIWERDFYVPFYRETEESDKPKFPNVKSGLVRQKAFNRLKGGTDKLNHDLLANTLMNWSHILNAAAKNRAARASLTAAEQVGAATKAQAGESGAVSFREGGKEQFYQVEDPFILDAVTALEFSGFSGPAMKTMGAFKRWLTMGVTASPAFKIRNLIRDSISAIGQGELSYNPLKNLSQGFKATDKKSQTYASMLAGGGIIRFGTMIEGARADHVRRLVESGVDPDTIIDSESKLKAIWKRHVMPIVDAYNELGDRSEGINRAALYEQLRAKGMSHAEASYAARDLLDFSMSGTYGPVRFLTQVVPFANARIQGLYKLGRATKENPKRMGYVVGAVALASLALLGAYHDDDDWKKREDWDRDNYWWFKIAGKAFRIPKPFEIGSIGTLAERSAELLFDKEMDGKRFGKRLGKMVGDTFAMNPVPQMFKPIIDLYANTDSFTGRAIETMGMERMRTEDRFTARTSEAAKVIGKTGVLSPVQIDHLIRGYFGWLGTAATTSVDQIVRIGSDNPRPSMQLKDVFLAGNFVESLPSNSSRYVTQMYEQSKEVEEAYNSWRHYLKIGDIDKAKSVFEANKGKITKYQQVQAVKRVESSLNAQAQRIEADKTKSGDLKRVELDRIAVQKDKTARLLGTAGLK